jgi:adenylate kinase
MQRSGTVIVILGGPGAGKGTQAHRLSSALGIPTVSTGEMMRHESRSGSPLGAHLQRLLTAGQLVNDELIEELVSQRLAQPDCARGCILDGFPRTGSQARFLDHLLAELRFDPPIVFDLTIAPEELMARLSSRRQCPTCDRTFHVARGASGNCPHDGAALVFRTDDQPVTIRRRLQIHADHTTEIVRYYQPRGYHSIDASQPVEEITRGLLKELAQDGRSAKRTAQGSAGSSRFGTTEPRPLSF